MRKDTARFALLCFAGLCYPLFLAIDFFLPSLAALSSPVKYAGLLACAGAALLGKDALLRPALLLTALCDLLLLFTPHHALGVLLFCGVQVLHGLRHARMAAVSPRKTLLPVGIAGAVIAPILFLFTKDALTAAAAAYGALLLTAAALAAVALFRRGRACRPAALACAGMLLFVACDVCVAAFNMGAGWAAGLMWLFYLPSQMLLSRSSVT